VKYQWKYSLFYSILLKLKNENFYSRNTHRCKRATPSDWANYTTSFKVIKTIRDKGPSILYERLNNNLYAKNRRPGLGFFFDKSSKRRGKQILQNRLPFFKSISTQWMVKDISDKAIRIRLKKCFFTCCTDKESIML